MRKRMKLWIVMVLSAALISAGYVSLSLNSSRGWDDSGTSSHGGIGFGTSSNPPNPQNPQIVRIEEISLNAPNNNDQHFGVIVFADAEGNDDGKGSDGMKAYDHGADVFINAIPTDDAGKNVFGMLVSISVSRDWAEMLEMPLRPQDAMGVSGFKIPKITAFTIIQAVFAEREEGEVVPVVPQHTITSEPRGVGYTIEAPATVEDGEDDTFTVTLEEQFLNTMPIVRLNDGAMIEPECVTQGFDTGVWTFDLEFVTGDITITVDLLYTVTFNEGGSVATYVELAEDEVSYNIIITITPTEGTHVIKSFTIDGEEVEGLQSSHTYNVTFESPFETIPIQVEFEQFEEPPVETPPTEEPPVEEPPVETPPVETPPVEEPPVETPPVEEPPVETPPVEEPPVETPGGTGPGDAGSGGAGPGGNDPIGDGIDPMVIVGGIVAGVAAVGAIIGGIFAVIQVRRKKLGLK